MGSVCVCDCIFYICGSSLHALIALHVASKYVLYAGVTTRWRGWNACLVLWERLACEFGSCISVMMPAVVDRLVDDLFYGGVITMVAVVASWILCCLLD